VVFQGNHAALAQLSAVPLRHTKEQLYIANVRYSELPIDLTSQQHSVSLSLDIPTHTVTIEGVNEEEVSLAKKKLEGAYQKLRGLSNPSSSPSPSSASSSSASVSASSSPSSSGALLLPASSSFTITFPSASHTRYWRQYQSPSFHDVYPSLTFNDVSETLSVVITGDDAKVREEAAHKIKSANDALTSQTFRLLSPAPELSTVHHSEAKTRSSVVVLPAQNTVHIVARNQQILNDALSLLNIRVQPLSSSSSSSASASSSTPSSFSSSRLFFSFPTRIHARFFCRHQYASLSRSFPSLKLQYSNVRLSLRIEGAENDKEQKDVEAALAQLQQMQKEVLTTSFKFAGPFVKEDWVGLEQQWQCSMFYREGVMSLASNQQEDLDALASLVQSSCEPVSFAVDAALDADYLDRLIVSLNQEFHKQAYFHRDASNASRVMLRAVQPSVVAQASERYRASVTDPSRRLLHRVQSLPFNQINRALYYYLHQHRRKLLSDKARELALASFEFMSMGGKKPALYLDDNGQRVFHAFKMVGSEQALDQMTQFIMKLLSSVQYTDLLLVANHQDSIKELRERFYVHFAVKEIESMGTVTVSFLNHRRTNHAVVCSEEGKLKEQVVAMVASKFQTQENTTTNNNIITTNNNNTTTASAEISDPDLSPEPGAEDSFMDLNQRFEQFNMMISGGGAEGFNNGF